MTKVYLNKKINPRIAQGHPWIYNNEVDRIAGPIEPGDIVEVYFFNGQLAGRGYINPNSQIIIRLLTRKREEIDANFFYEKIKTAWAYRQQLGYTENCRLVFGEADGLPALIIDKFNDYFVLQTLSLGMDIWKQAIVDAIQKIFSPKGIYERNDVPVRELEGLTQVKDFLTEPFPTEIIIKENDLQFYVNIETGQKTGYFLDQQDNRRAIKEIVKGADVLGAFTYTGTFEIHAAHYGAKSVLGIDISESAVAQANKNAALNKLDHIVKFEAMNAFDVLKKWGKEGRKYDVVMLDPPAFTKSRNNIDKAITGYKEINLRGMQMLRNGGFLVTSSCTNLVSPELFLETIQMAAWDAKKRIRQVTYQSQSSDHPIIWGMENTHYLKFLIVEVCDR
ncbi:MAG: class I SAM-dependent rRNA methyltransferase [Chitinophagaceae bacterium]|nr:class I SAM-dependent rRNA methyltransferase [Chitinophagaceae bacterium]